jgi:hypothetical protein
MPLYFAYRQIANFFCTPVQHAVRQAAAALDWRAAALQSKMLHSAAK